MILQKYKKVPVDKIKIINFILTRFFIFVFIDIFFEKMQYFMEKNAIFFL